MLDGNLRFGSFHQKMPAFLTSKSPSECNQNPMIQPESWLSFPGFPSFQFQKRPETREASAPFAPASIRIDSRESAHRAKRGPAGTAAGDSAAASSCTSAWPGPAPRLGALCFDGFDGGGGGVWVGGWGKDLPFGCLFEGTPKRDRSRFWGLPPNSLGPNLWMIG